LSARRDQIALRKEALRMRASLERIELANVTRDFRRAARLPGLLGVLVGGLSRGLTRGLSSGRLPWLVNLVRRLPIVAGIMPMLARHAKGPLLRNGLRAAAIALLAWQGIRIAASIGREARARRAAASGYGVEATDAGSAPALSGAPHEDRSG
jgi:hypothetical protein